MLRTQLGHTVLNLFAYDVQGALKSRDLVVGHARDEHLLDVRLCGESGFAEASRVGGHRAQVSEAQSFALDFFNHDRQDQLLAGTVLGKEDKARAVLTLLGNRDALQQDELVWYLQQDARTIARLAVGTLGATMAQVLQHFQCVVDEIVALVAVDVHDHAHATSVVLVGGIIQSFPHNLNN